MLRREGSVATIFAIREYFPALQALGFSPDEVLSIGGYRGGAKTIGAVLAHYGELNDQGLSHKQIVKIASHDHGSRHIQYTLKDAGPLIENGDAKGTSQSMHGDRTTLHGSVGEQETWSKAEREALFAYGAVVSYAGLGDDGGESHNKSMVVEPFSLGGPGADKEKLAQDAQELRRLGFS